MVMILAEVVEVAEAEEVAEVVGIPLHLVPQVVEEESVHPLVTNLVLEVSTILRV